jgi:chromosome segregation ATPase
MNQDPEIRTKKIKCLYELHDLQDWFGFPSSQYSISSSLEYLESECARLKTKKQKDEEMFEELKKPLPEYRPRWQSSSYLEEMQKEHKKIRTQQKAEDSCLIL